MAENYGLPSMTYGLLQGIVAHALGLLGFAGRSQYKYKYHFEVHRFRKMMQ